MTFLLKRKKKRLFIDKCIDDLKNKIVYAQSVFIVLLYIVLYSLSVWCFFVTIDKLNDSRQK